MTRNPGTDLRTDGFADIRINTPAVERRAATLPRPGGTSKAGISPDSLGGA